MECVRRLNSMRMTDMVTPGVLEERHGQVAIAGVGKNHDHDFAGAFGAGCIWSS